MSWSFGPFTFHVYGLVMGFAVLSSIYLGSIIAKRHAYSQQQYERLVIIGLVGSIVGARLWHVVTDFAVYQHNLIATFYVWRGGLSIIGAVIGLVISILLWEKTHSVTDKRRISSATFFDILAFGLPFGQAIGRLGNFFNQELYGLPTQLPWAITIEPQYRLVGFEQYDRFHPLFAYEMIFTLVTGSMLWLFYLSLLNPQTPKKLLSFFRIGTSHWFLLYLGLYSMGRFLLDFLRVDTSPVLFDLGINQLLLCVVTIGCTASLLYRWRSVK